MQTETDVNDPLQTVRPGDDMTWVEIFWAPAYASVACCGVYGQTKLQCHAGRRVRMNGKGYCKINSTVFDTLDLEDAKALLDELA